MNIVVLHGSPRKGNTDHIVNRVKSEMCHAGDFSFQDFYFPQDAPVFCKGCFTCFEKGEQACPNARYIQPIAKAMEQADGLIIACPVYVLQLPGSLKAFLDHMAYRYLNHRPFFFRHQAMIITTTAGAGTGNVIKYIRQNLHFWGIHHVVTLGVTMKAGSIEEMPQKRLQKLTSVLKEKSRRFSRQLEEKKITPTLLSVVIFNISRKLHLTLPSDHADRRYWEQHGWFSSKAAYYIEEIHPGMHRSLMGRIAAWAAFK
jgi:multimeric flavodoxin WrbA